MTAPIVIELVADPPLRPELVEGLVTSCTGAAGTGGCVLGTPSTPVDARARVVVELDGECARVRVEAVAPVGASGPHVREVTFREGDPVLERFRAAGLVVAGLVFDLEPTKSDVNDANNAVVAGQGSSAGPPVTPVRDPAAPVVEGVLSPAPKAATLVPAAEPASHEPIVFSIAGLAGWGGTRPWWGAWTAADFPLRVVRAFATSSLAYEQTWSESAIGISEQRLAWGAGVGFAVPVGSDRIQWRTRVELELQDIRASVVQAATGRSDAGGRFLVGASATADVGLPLGPAMKLIVGGQAAWLGASTPVFVQNMPATTISPWLVTLTAGLDFAVR